MAREMKLLSAPEDDDSGAAADDSVDIPRGAVKAAILLRRATCAVERGAKLSYDTLCVLIFVVVLMLLPSSKAKDDDYSQ
jgi:hypothetical protein